LQCWEISAVAYCFSGSLEIVFRIYDNCLANGIEAIFGFSIMLLKKNETTLLSLKFDEILAFLNTKLFDCYLLDPGPNGEAGASKYMVDEFVHDAVSLRITPFMLDSYRHEYEDLVVSIHLMLVSTGNELNCGLPARDKQTRHPNRRAEK